MASPYSQVKEWRRNTKIKLFEAFGSKCGACGLIDDPIIYDFHHLDESIKEFGLSGSIMSWAKLKKEALKCVMLCSHCHRKLHGEQIEIDDSLLSFDESLIMHQKNNRYGFKDNSRLV